MYMVGLRHMVEPGFRYGYREALLSIFWGFVVGLWHLVEPGDRFFMDERALCIVAASVRYDALPFCLHVFFLASVLGERPGAAGRGSPGQGL